MRTWIAIAAISILSLPGCAGTRIALPQPDATTRASLVELLHRPIESSRGIPADDRIAAVDRIDRSVLPAAVDVCERTFNDPDNCPGLLYGRTLAVDAHNEGINAFVGDRFNITVLGGLVRSAGSDDEIALVLAHEYAHAMLGHVATMRANAVWGEVLGGLAGLATIAATADYTTAAQREDIVLGSTEVGAMMGQTVFSKDMELEADHLALLILADAGYDPRRSMQFFQRTLRLQHQINLSGQGRIVGFFATHPSDEQRLLQLLATMASIEQGVMELIWKQ